MDGTSGLSSSLFRVICIALEEVLPHRSGLHLESDPSAPFPAACPFDQLESLERLPRERKTFFADIEIEIKVVFVNKTPKVGRQAATTATEISAKDQIPE